MVSTSENPMNEIRKIIKENSEHPDNKKAGQIITYKGNIEHHATQISGIRGRSHFDSYKETLADLVKKCRPERGSYGWITANGIEVVVEKYFDFPPNYFKENPAEWDSLMKYGHCKKRCLVTKFYVENKKGEKKIHYIYGKLKNDPFFS